MGHDERTETPSKNEKPSGMGGGFDFRADGKFPCHSPVCEPAEGSAQNTAQDPLGRERQRLRARRAASGADTRESGFGLVRRDVHGGRRGGAESRRAEASSGSNGLRGRRRAAPDRA